jgi:SAM-dependent methyltransferase
MADPVADTLAWYKAHAEDFAARTCRLDLGLLYDRFLHYLGPGGRILDAGCGPGRDTAALIARGYEVVAFDATEEMVRLARSRIGHGAQIHRMRFEDVAWTAEFDGIWACGSLLHVPLASFAGIVSTLAGALRPSGAFYMSFKLGDGERISGGRLFLDFTPESLRRSLQTVPLALVETWLSDDVRPKRQGERWVNAIATA